MLQVVTKCLATNIFCHLYPKFVTKTIQADKGVLAVIWLWLNDLLTDRFKNFFSSFFRSDTTLSWKWIFFSLHIFCPFFSFLQFFWNNLRCNFLNLSRFSLYFNCYFLYFSNLFMIYRLYQSSPNGPFSRSLSFFVLNSDLDFFKFRFFFFRIRLVFWFLLWGWPWD